MALLKEMQLQFEKSYLKTDSVQTVYFGGGTPSLLSTEELLVLMNRIRNLWNVTASAEITLEANPDDVTNEKLNGWKEAGVNRLSIGIQSLFDEDLQWMNRAHTATEAREVIQKSKAAGFDQFSIDLIYGTPYLSDEQWNEELEWVLQQQVKHLSCYALTVEPQTPLAKQIALHQSKDTDAEKQSRQFLQLMHFMQQAGYEHYEISNFALPGNRSKHNSSYWKGIPYLGIGPSAHSFNGVARQWNIANNQQYIQQINEGLLPATVETLSPVQMLNEYIMISIRTIEGCSLTKVEMLKGDNSMDAFYTAISQFKKMEWIKEEQHHVILTGTGKLFADKIAAELFF